MLLAQGGDRAAFAELVERYDRRLLYFVRRILDGADEAFDVVQGVWLQVQRTLPKLQAPRAFRVWLYRIAHDQAISTLRRRSRERLRLDDVPVDNVPDNGAPATDFEAADLVHTALGALSVDHRRVLTLRFLEEMSVNEIADVLQCSAGTVKSRLYYAKAALRRRIEEIEHV